MGLIKLKALYRDIYNFTIGGNGEYTPYTGEKHYYNKVTIDVNKHFGALADSVAFGSGV